MLLTRHTSYMEMQRSKNSQDGLKNRDGGCGTHEPYIKIILNLQWLRQLKDRQIHMKWNGYTDTNTVWFVVKMVLQKNRNYFLKKWCWVSCISCRRENPHLLHTIQKRSDKENTYCYYI